MASTAEPEVTDLVSLSPVDSGPVAVSIDARGARDMARLERLITWRYSR